MAWGGAVCKDSPFSLGGYIMKRRFIRDRTGEGYVDVAITLLIVITFFASLMALFPIFTAQQNLNQTAKYMARTVELYGKADDATLQSVTVNGHYIVPDTVEVDTVWYDVNQKTIQLKTPFVVTVTKTVPISIMRPALGESVEIKVKITASARGISEVYWK
jgi:Flp pilus assembly protein TadG